MRQPEVAVTATPNLHDARVFCTVVDLGSLTAAAKAHGETKGNISRRVARLEVVLGVSLVRRGPRQVVPTEVGLSYREGLRAALALLDEAAARVQGGATQPRGRLRVTAPVDIALLCLPQVVARFIELYPAVRVDVLTTDSVVQVEANQVDIALRASLRLPDSSLVGRRLLDLSAGFYAAPSYLEGRRPLRTTADLVDHRLLVLGSVADSVLARMAGTGAQTLRPVVRCDGAFLRELTLAGGGIAPLPDLLVARDVVDGRLTRVLRRATMPRHFGLFVLSPPNRANAPAVAAFRQLLADWFAGAEARAVNPLSWTAAGARGSKGPTGRGPLRSR